MACPRGSSLLPTGSRLRVLARRHKAAWIGTPYGIGAPRASALRLDLFIESELAGLFRLRQPLVRQRNTLIDKPLFLFRGSLRARVKEIDGCLDIVDSEIKKCRDRLAALNEASDLKKEGKK